MLLSLILSFLLHSPTANAAGKSASSDSGGSGLTLAVNIPHVYDISYETLNRASHLTYAVSFGYVPPITISIAQVTTFNFDARARYHPFGGAFFLGLTGGYQSYGATGSQIITVSGQNLDVTLKDTLSGMYITPHFGWLWMFGKLLAGLEVGVQTAVGSKNNLVPSLADPTQQSYLTQAETLPSYKQLVADVDKGITTLTKLPYVAFKLGWKF